MDFRNSNFQQACITSARGVVLENLNAVQEKVQHSYPFHIYVSVTETSSVLCRSGFYLFIYLNRVLSLKWTNTI